VAGAKERKTDGRRSELDVEDMLHGETDVSLFAR
jgi:hypothetical protein